jgi:predicted house-cleaning NTP pyrophosphatase (Maf/HAM1 superfamily)
VFVERIVGEYSNVVGLPLALVSAQLRAFGLNVADGWPDR